MQIWMVSLGLLAEGLQAIPLAICQRADDHDVQMAARGLARGCQSFYLL